MIKDIIKSIRDYVKKHENKLRYCFNNNERKSLNAQIKQCEETILLLKSKFKYYE